jgi:hypothetical protein
MNERIKELEKQCWSHRVNGTLVDGQLHFDTKKFAELIAEYCAQLCGSQADKKNIRNAFGISVGSDVKYPGPEAHNSVVSQYTREYNIPKVLTLDKDDSKIV